jgi:hypothetical protein
VEAESRTVSDREGWWQLLINERRVFVSQDEKVLEAGGRIGLPLLN